MKFRDKVVWITGASSGIGEALAYAFYREGARLILSARRQSELERVRQIAGDDGRRVFVLPLDLADVSSLPEKARQGLDAFGRVDLLINNGGVGQVGRAVDTTVAVDERIMRTNFLGQVALTKEVLPAMVRARAGHIVVISSVSGKIGVPGRAAYSASKHALQGYFDSLRAEVWRDHIKVTLVCPGFVRTQISYNALRGDGTPRGKNDQAHKRAMTAEKCAAAILKAIAQGKEEVYIGGPETYAVYLKRFFPGLASFALKWYRRA